MVESRWQLEYWCDTVQAAYWLWDALLESWPAFVLLKALESLHDALHQSRHLDVHRR